MKINTYIPPEAEVCSLSLQLLLNESAGMIDPGIEDVWGDV